MVFHGVDISSNNGVVNLTNLKDCDFVIVKATQGVNYKNPLFESSVNEALSRGLMVGVYHYFGGGDVIMEARHFLNTVRPYLVRVSLWLDWESNQNPKFGAPLVAVRWLEYVFECVGVTPGIYMSKSVVPSFSGYSVEKFPLWVAQYGDMKTRGWQSEAWTDKKPFTPWKAPFIHQYSSRGNIWPHKGFLDLNIGYFDREDWDRLCSNVPAPVVKPSENHRPLELAEVVCDVLRGKYGSGAARAADLKEAGYNYNNIQKIVNLICELSKR